MPWKNYGVNKSLYFIFIDLAYILEADIKDLITIEQMEKTRKPCTTVCQIKTTYKNKFEDWIFLFQQGGVSDFTGELFIPVIASNLSTASSKQLPTANNMETRVREWNKVSHSQ